MLKVLPAFRLKFPPYGDSFLGFKLFSKLKLVKGLLGTPYETNPDLFGPCCNKKLLEFDTALVLTLDPSEISNIPFPR
ncbi:hypothetical protein D9M71_500890 [compost metagenome]